jgi:hypothetical protein
MDQVTLGYESAVNEVCSLRWAALDRSQLTAVAWAYYFFSILFRENLEVLHRKYPDNSQVQRLVQEECATDNLSPWPDVAAKVEKLNHDEFMRRNWGNSSITSDRSRSRWRARLISHVAAEWMTRPG